MPTKKIKWSPYIHIATDGTGPLDKDRHHFNREAVRRYCQLKRKLKKKEPAKNQTYTLKVYSLNLKIS